jgi:rfaE bifunctional protein kinase chain/domain
VTPARFAALAAAYPRLRLALVGDFCLDRYLEIDPARAETSIETGLTVHNVVRVRSQPGAAGTILNNLVALGVGEVHAVGFCGDDGEGYELRRALAGLAGVATGHFLTSAERRTFTYCKPLLLHAGRPPEELHRLDSKNWSPTPAALEDRLIASLRELAPAVDGVIVMDQVDVPETGVVTARVRAALGGLAEAFPQKLFLADSRRGLAGWPALDFKMNAAELAALTSHAAATVDEMKATAAGLATRTRRPVFVTLAERGIVGALPEAAPEHVPALPVRGPIDIVGAGDAVTANLAAALAAGATPAEAMQLAMAAASAVIHQLGTTGTATVADLRERAGVEAAN